MAELIIVFREVLESSLIVGILYTYLIKTKQKDKVVNLWQGVILAIFLSGIGSVVFQVLVGGFKGQAEKIFEGIVMIIASFVLGTMIVWMAKNRNISDDLKNKADMALSNNRAKYGIFALAFISVFREGIETILFLYGVMIQQGSLSISSSLFGAFLGVSIGILIFVQGRRVPLKIFFNVSSIILIFVSAGMFAYGIHELESAGIIKDYGRAWDINPQINLDGSYPLFHDKGYIGSLIKGLFGYNGDPSYIELICWVSVLSGLGYLWNTFKTQEN